MDQENYFLKQMIRTYYRPNIDKQERMLKNIKYYLLMVIKIGKFDKESVLNIIKNIDEVLES